ncbi:MAG: DUF853 family protein, partial [Solirubrobacterales bacterium]|nr:DUF853 family protein [Solirubrobacterales bacterium]
MSSPARRRSRPPYWLLLAFPLIMMIPPPLGVALAIAAVLLRVAITVARALAARRARAAAMEGRSGTVALGVASGGRPVLVSDEQLSAHGLIVGASGAGKSTTLLRILTEQVRHGTPVVAIDLKGSPAFAARLGDSAWAYGRPFALWTPDGPAHWNPLAHGNATELKDKLIATERFTEPHYQRAAERYLQTVLQVLEYAERDRAPTLGEIVSLMDTRRLHGALRGLPRPMIDRVQDYLEELPHDQVSAIRGLAARLAILTESHTGRYLAPGDRGSAPPIDLRRALTQPGVTLFSLNSSTYGKLAAQIGTLVIQDLVAAAGRRLDPSPGARGAGLHAGASGLAIVAIDEFSALGADHVLALVARGREAGVSALLVTQEFVDLERAGRGLRDQIIGNTAVKIVHRQEVPASAQLVSELIGTERVWEETEQLGGPWLRGYGGSRREVERFVVHPNEIKTLRQGEAVVIAKVPATSVDRVLISPPAVAAAPAPRAPTAPRT